MYIQFPAVPVHGFLIFSGKCHQGGSFYDRIVMLEKYWNTLVGISGFPSFSVAFIQHVFLDFSFGRGHTVAQFFCEILIIFHVFSVLNFICICGCVSLD